MKTFALRLPLRPALSAPALLLTCALLAVPLPGILTATAQEAPKADPGEITADQIIKKVQDSRALRDAVLQGELTKDDKTVPFTVTLKSDLISFQFTNPVQTVSLNINDKGSQLTETAAGSNRLVPVPDKRYNEGIRGTDLTYDDISFRYLYWEKRVKQPIEETVKTRKCHVVDLYAPKKIGDYGLVRIFAEKESGALLKIYCYDWEGKMIKECAVTAGMKVNGSTMLKSMEVIRYVAGTKKVTGETTFELKKP
ncbi:MAG: outer membrane lipoprotein-sorting protein [Verrucomicrobiota bacterium]